MAMVGDGPEGQPTEGVESLSQLGEMFGEDEDTPEESAQDEGDEDSEVDEAEEEGAEDAEDEEQQDEPTVVLKHDGKEVTLKQSEVVELAQQGFDYTKKTMAVAEERKAVEAERSQVRQIQTEVTQHREQAINDLRVLHAFVEDQIGPPPDISLAAQDAHQYLVQKEWHDGQRAKLGQVSQALQTLLQQQEAEKATRLAEKQRNVERQLLDTLPGWKDAPAEKFKEATDYLTGIGLTSESVGDAALEVGFWQLAHKAREYDRLMAEKSKLKPKEQMPKVSKPGASNPVSKPAAAKARKLEAHNRAPSLSTIGDFL